MTFKNQYSVHFQLSATILLLQNHQKISNITLLKFTKFI